MASQKFERNSKEYVLFIDFWKLCQFYYIPENSEAYWDELIQSINVFLKKHNNTVFAQGLARALVDDLESRNERQVMKKDG